MEVHRIWTVAVLTVLCAVAAPTPAPANTYNMTVQSVPEAGGKCVSAPNGQFAEGMHALLWDCNAFLAQALIYNDQSQELKFGANCVEVLGQGSPQDAVGVGACNGSVRQRWSMVANGDNYQVIGVNNLCLDITNGVIANGTPLDLSPCVSNKAVELWVLFQASDASATNQTNNGTTQANNTPNQASNATNQSSNPGGGSGQANNAPGQTASTSPGDGSGSGGSSSGPGGGGSSPGEGSSGSGGGPGLPSPIGILVGMLSPPYGGTTDQPNSMYPPTDHTGDQPSNMSGLGPPTDTGKKGMGPPDTSGGNMTPTSGTAPFTQQLCGLGADGQLVTANLSFPVSANAPSTTGQYCMSGGTLDGQCGTINATKTTMQMCMHGQCTPPLPFDMNNPQLNAYNPMIFGVPASSTTVPCPSTTTASSDPMGALGPPMMDQKTGMPTYHPSLQPRGQLAGPPPQQTITVALPMPQYPPGGAVPSGSQNICQPKASSQNVCQPKSATPSASATKPPNICNPTPAKSANVCNPSPPPKSSELNLKPRPGTGASQAAGAANATPPLPGGPLTLKPNQGTQMASAGSASTANPCTTKTQVQACESKPPFLPWGGTGSATITVSGKPCGIGWHDTGATILDSMSVSSPPAHGSLKPQDQHVIIFSPTPGYKGQDSFMLTMREHNGGRSATLRVKVSVTIQ